MWPTPPDAPVISTRAPSSGPPPRTRFAAVVPAIGSAAATGEVHLGGNDGEAMGGNDRLLGPAVPLREPRDALAHLRPGAVRCRLDDLARHVLARLPAVAAALDERELAPVDGERADGEQRLVGRGRRRRDLAALGERRSLGGGDDGDAWDADRNPRW